MSAATPDRLNSLLAEAGLPALDSDLSVRFANYLALLLRWNRKVNLTSVRDEDGILRRHFIESIACSDALPTWIGTLLDFGSGGGFPGIPIALCRPEIAVTLAESQNKKAAFLREAVRTLGISANVHAGRAEALDARFDCVILRGVDRMEAAVSAGARLVASTGLLALMTVDTDFERLQRAAGVDFSWSEPIPFPFSENRVLVLGSRLGGIDARR
jgi:16S rRNA (guanine527-N7)-methyltransferase